MRMSGKRETGQMVNKCDGIGWKGETGKMLVSGTMTGECWGH